MYPVKSKDLVAGRFRWLPSARPRTASFKARDQPGPFALHADARITEQCRANCIYDNACLVRDGIKRDGQQLYLLYATLTPVPTDRPTDQPGRPHFMRTKLRFAVANANATIPGRNCRISHNETRSRELGIHREAECTAEWNRESLFQYRSGLQDRAESIKIRQDTVYDRCVSLVCGGNAT